MAKKMKLTENYKILTVAVVAVAVFVMLLKMRHKEKKEGLSIASMQTGSSVGDNTVLTTRGVRNNNPFNIVFTEKNKWKGQKGSDGKFCVFETMDYGVRAGKILLKNYLKGGRNTIETILTAYAPSSDGNNTEKYINDVAAASGHSRKDVLTDGDLFSIAKPICRIESRYELVKSQWERV